MAPKRSAENLGTWKVLLQLARPYRKRFILIALLALLGTGADLLQPLIYRTAINDVAGMFVDRVEEKAGPPVAPAEAQPSIRDQQLERLEKTQLPHRPNYVAPRTRRQALTTLLWSVALLFGISVVGYFLSLAADLQSTAVACAIESNLIQATFGHVLRLPLAFFNRRASGGLARRIDQSDQVAPIVSAVARQIAPELLSIAGICAIMLTQSWRLTVAALAILPVYLIITRHAARRLESGMAEYYVMWENVSVRINDALAAIKTVKLSGAESREGDRLQAASQEAYSDYVDRARLGNRYLFLQSALSHFSKALVLGYGGWMVMDRRLTPGDVVMFVAYLDRIYDPIDSLSSIAVNLQQHMASLHRAVRLLDTHPMELSGAELQPGPGAVEFRQVAFGYGPEREVLRGITFTAEAGKVTAITGPSGAGKTTAADLLLKLWEPDSGEIRIDGQCLSQLDPSSVRRAIGMVAADGAVFRGTLAENVRYKRPGATDREVRDAAIAAGLGDLLDRLPQGLATEIGERGVGLSVGERQRLQIARILVDRPRILVLDEATANLDYATEQEVKKSLGGLSYRPTTLVIAHRYSMVKDADYVIVMDQGRIVEQGAPDQLIAARGWFAHLATQSAPDVQLA
jgi:ABC-type multidrug transport system fused ATPase/permease subunit